MTAAATNDNSTMYTPVRITNPEDIVGGGAAGTVTLAAGTAGIGKLTANSGVTIGAVELAASQTVGLAAGAAAVGTVGVTSVSPPSAIFAAVTNVTTAGTRVVLAASQAIARGVLVTARSGNTGVIYVGTAAAVSSSVYGIILNQGQSIYVECNNLNLVGLDSATSGDGVSYFAS